jgi:hypothetical protein
MIYWMSDKVNKVWDEKCPWLKGIVCEIHDEELKGHIVLQLEINDDEWYQLDLGVCDGISDEAINERFVRKFGDFVKEYEDSDECCGPILEDLEELRDEFLKTIENN